MRWRVCELGIVPQRCRGCNAAGCDNDAKASSCSRMRVFFFAQLKEVTGIDRAEISGEGLDADKLWAKLIERWPGLKAHRSNTRLARNGAYADRGEMFAGDDEVALIPPVSGG